MHSQVPLGGSGILEPLRSSTSRKNILFGGPLSLGLSDAKPGALPNMGPGVS